MRGTREAAQSTQFSIGLRRKRNSKLGDAAENRREQFSSSARVSVDGRFHRLEQVIKINRINIARSKSIDISRFVSICEKWYETEARQRACGGGRDGEEREDRGGGGKKRFVGRA